MRNKDGGHKLQLIKLMWKTFQYYFYRSIKQKISQEIRVRLKIFKS